MKNLITFTLYLSTLLFIASCTISPKSKITVYDKTPKEIEKIDNNLERFVEMFTGHFNNQAQMDSSSAPIPGQEILIRRIWEDRAEEYWTCSAWFMSGSFEKPMLLCLVRYKQIAPDTFVSENYSILDMDENFDQWKAPNGFENLSPKDLQGEPARFYFVFDKKNRLVSVQDQFFPSLMDSAIPTYSKTHIEVTQSSIFTSSTIINEEEEVLQSLSLYFERVSQDDPHYYAPLQ